MFDVESLQPGDNTVYVCASDPQGAQVCTTTVITVDPASSDYNVEEAVFATDVRKAVDVNDPSAVSDTAGRLLNQDSIMREGGSGQGGSSNRRRRLLETAGSGSSGDDVVLTKLVQLLAATAEYATANTMDAATLRQVSGSLQPTAGRSAQTPVNGSVAFARGSIQGGLQPVQHQQYYVAITKLTLLAN